MFFSTLAVSSVLLAVAHASPEPAPYKLGSMSLNSAFGLLKRQAGYQPTQTYCGPGADCATSCGATFAQCASSDGDLHCYDPTVKETCCPDGSGSMYLILHLLLEYTDSTPQTPAMMATTAPPTPRAELGAALMYTSPSPLTKSHTNEHREWT